MGFRGLFRRLNVLLRGPIDEAALQELEEALVAGDVSIETSAALVAELRSRLRGQSENAQVLLKRIIAEMLAPFAAALRTRPPAGASEPVVWLVAGVNGTGKTTTIAKLARRLIGQGVTPILAAGDTFRAAAAEQLQIWGDRLGARTVAGKPGSDAAAVVFDAIQAARSGKSGAVIADTAGRLHTKHNLMEELKKIARTVERANGRPADETLLVLDATTGQNALSQAREFAAAVSISGLILTKMDGTAKGGTLITIARETGLPVKAIGTGESVDDLEDFDPQAYSDQLFEE